LLAVVLGGFEAVHECREELATGVLEDKHRHDGRYLETLVVLEMWGYSTLTCSAR
jgi:cobalamin biosynthesis Mg chelatase CobN